MVGLLELVVNEDPVLEVILASVFLHARLVDVRADQRRRFGSVLCEHDYIDVSEAIFHGTFDRLRQKDVGDAVEVQLGAEHYPVDLLGVARLEENAHLEDWDVDGLHVQGRQTINLRFQLFHAPGDDRFLFCLLTEQAFSVDVFLLWFCFDHFN